VKPRLTLFLQNEIVRENDCGADIVFRFADGVSDDGNDSDPKDDRPIVSIQNGGIRFFRLG